MCFRKIFFIVGCIIPMLGIAQEAAENQGSLDQLNADFQALEVQFESLKTQYAELLGADMGTDKEGSWDLTVDLSALWFRPAVSGLDYAIADPASTGEPNGELQRLEPENYMGARIEIMASVPSSPLQFGAAISAVSGDSSSAADTNSGSLWHTRMHSDSSIDSEITSAAAEYEFDYIVADLILKKEITRSDAFVTELNGGLSLAKIEQLFYVDYVDGASTARFTESNELTGLGAFIGAEGRWNMGWGFSLDGSAGAALMITSTEYAVSDDVFSTFTEYKYDLIPVINAGLGLGWSMDFADHWNAGVRVAYEAENWINAYYSMRTVDDVDEGKVTPTESDIALHGLVGTLSLSCSF